MISQDNRTEGRRAKVHLEKKLKVLSKRTDLQLRCWARLFLLVTLAKAFHAAFRIQHPGFTGVVRVARRANIDVVSFVLFVT